MNWEATKVTVENLKLRDKYVLFCVRMALNKRLHQIISQQPIMRWNFNYNYRV